MKRCTRRVPQLRWWLMGFFWLLLPGLSWAGLSNLRTGGKLVPTQTTVADGDKLSVTVPVWNNGPDTTRTSQTGSPRSSYLYVYLSRNPGDLNGARSLKSVVIASLNAGARVNVKVDIQIPTGWVAGTSYLHAVVDGYGNYVKNESNENDNYSYVYGHSVALSVVHKRSNLRTSAPLKPSKTSVLDGEKITVSVPVWNNGNAETLNGIVGSSRTFYVYVYISSNPGTEAGGTRVGSLLVPTLAAGAKRDAQIQVTIPTNYRRGVAYLHAIVDSYGNYVKNESNENDNASYTYGHSISINVDRIRSNLRTNGAMTATKTSLKEGETITVNVPIINNGNDETRSSVTGGSRSYYVYLYLGTRQGTLTDSKYISGRLMNSLVKGGRVTATISFKVPAGQRAGDYYIHAFVDGYGNYVKNESDETDNYSYVFGHSLKVQISRARSNLRTRGSLTVTNSSPAPGSSILVTVPIINNGNTETLTAVGGTPRTFYVGIYLSRHPYQLGTYLGRTLVTSQKAGATANPAYLVTIPTSWKAGMSYIHARVDEYGSYVKNESDENDNNSYYYNHSTTLLVSGSGTQENTSWSDLRTDKALSLNKTRLAENELLEVRATIKNIGNTQTLSAVGGIPANVRVTFYISRQKDTLDNAQSLGTVTLPSMTSGETLDAVLKANVPKAWPQGTSYIHTFITVAKNESNSTNNYSYETNHSTAVTVNYDASNLRVGTALQPCQSQVSLGNQFCAKVLVQNTGAAETKDAFAGQPTTHRVDLYVSLYSNSLADAVKVGSVTINSLRAGASQLVTIYGNAPTTWVPGTSYVHAVVDAANNVKNESNEGDNSSNVTNHGASIVFKTSYSNLKTGSKLTTTQSTYNLSDQVNVSLTVTNVGTAETLATLAGAPARFNVQFYISQSASGLTGASSLGTVSADSLKPGATVKLTFRFALPANWPEGTSYIHAVVDSSNHIKNENNEGDNTSFGAGHSASIVLRRQFSNLTTAGKVVLSASTAEQSGYVKATVQVTNNGQDLPRTNFRDLPTKVRVRFYLSEYPDSISLGTSTLSYATVELTPGRVLTVSQTLSIPSSFTPGKAYVHVFVDDNNAAKNESNEGDNLSYTRSHSASITILKKPTTPNTAGHSNLRVGGPIRPATNVVTDGQKLYVTVPVQNNGNYVTARSVNGSVTSFYVRLYLSKISNSITGAASLTQLSTAYLNAKSTRELVFEVTIPAGWSAGTSYLHAFVDSYSNYVKNESDENDNYSWTTSHSATLKVENLRSNLRTDGTLIVNKATVVDGETIRVSVPIINNGDDWTRNAIQGSLRSFYVDVHISRNAKTITGSTQVARVLIQALDVGAKTRAELSIKVPVGWAAGTSYLHAVVDSYGNYVKNEKNEEDNYSYFYGHSKAITVGNLRSNLRTAAKMTADANSAYDNSYINVRIPVTNSGNDSTRNSSNNETRHYTYFYLSRYPGNLTGAVRLGSYYHQFLKAGASETATARLQIPSGWAVGTSYVHAVVDAYGNYVRNESNETDNYSYSYGHSLAIQVINRSSNLRTNGPIKLSHTTRNDGEYVTITVPVVNNGNDMTRASVNGSPRTFYVYTYISPRPGELTGAKHVGSTLVQSLNAGQTINVQMNVQVPVGTLASTWYVHAFVDSYGNYVKNESDEADNYSYSYGHSTSLKVTQLRSNLRTGGKVSTGRTAITAGDKFVMTVPVLNAGNAETLTAVAGSPRKFYVDVYISRHPTSLSGASRVGRYYAESLAATKVRNEQINVTIPTSSTWKKGGLVYLHAFVDSYGNYVKNESDETDNYSYAYGHSLAIKLNGTTPDPTPRWSNLYPSSNLWSDKSRVSEGQAITFSVTVSNNGQEQTLNKLGGTATNFVVRFYISKSANTLQGATHLRDTSIRRLPAGTSETATIHTNIPANWPAGVAYVHAYIDYAGNVGNESDRQDNLTFASNRSLQIYVGQYASNVRTSATLVRTPSTVTLGGKVTVQVSVINDGNENTLASFGGRDTNFKVTLYFSQRSNGLQAAATLGSFTVSTLKPRETRSTTMEVTIPTNWATQTGYLHAVVDSSNNVKNESNEGDNNSWQLGHSVPINILLLGSNVRTSASLKLSTTKVTYGSPVRATISYENNGKDETLSGFGGTPTRFKITVYISRQANGLLGASSLKTVTVDSLKAGKTGSVLVDLVIPQGWAEGVSYIHAFVDSSNNVKNENNEGDNYSYLRNHSASLTVSRGYSNLLTNAKITTSDSSPRVGDTIEVTAQVINSGLIETLTAEGGTPTTSRLSLYISQWADSYTGAIKLADFTVSSLKNKQTSLGRFRVQIPANWPPNQTAYLHVLVDSSNLVKNESNEADNWSYQNKHSIALSIRPAGAPPQTNGKSNLVHDGKITVSNSTPNDGDTITVQIKINNAGNTVTTNSSNKATKYYVDLYLSQQSGTLTGATRVSRLYLNPLNGNTSIAVPVQVTIPANSKGTWYLHSYLDAYGNYARNESNENDNISYSTGHSAVINVNQVRSNLQIASKIASSKGTLSAGDYLDVTVSVKNVGNATTLTGPGGTIRSHYLDLFLGPNSNNLTGASRLGRVLVRALKANETFTYTFQTQIPTSWKKGTSYLHGFTDAYANYVKNESNENDNYSWTTGHSTTIVIGEFRSNVRSGAELTTDVKTVRDNGYVNVTMTAYNDGLDWTRNALNGSTRSFYADLYLSRTNGTVTGAKYMGRVLFPALKPGERSRRLLRIQIPSGWAVGTSYLHAFYDSYGNYVKNESNESDNYTFHYGHSTSIQVVQNRSNLRAYAQIYLSNSSPKGGEYIEVNVPVTNNGSRETLNAVEGSPITHHTYVYIGPNPTSLQKATRLGGLYLRSMKAGEKTIAQLLVKVPTNLAAGTYYVHAFIDGYANRVRNESDENDNYTFNTGHSAPIHLGQPRSNLRTHRLLTLSSKQMKPGDRVTVTVPVINAGSDFPRTAISGTSPRTGYNIRVYVGSNANSLSGATQVGTYTFSTFHSAGGVVQHAVVFTVPNRSSGTYWVHAFVDSADVVKNESSESDNYSYSLGHSVQLGINVKRSNLQTRTKLSIPNVTVNEGASFTVSVPVWNNDNDATRDKVGGNSVRFDVWVYVSSFSNSIAGGSVVGKATYSTGLNAGGIATVQVPVQLPGGVVGSRYLHAVLNPIVGSSRKVGNERDVSNNTSHYYGHSTIVYISQGRSDLEFTQKLKASTTTLAAGGTLSITASAKNIGNATTRDRAGGSPQVVTISFTLNQNPFSAIGGTGLGTVQSSGAINPGQAVTLTRTLTIPKVAAGNYYLHGTLLKAGNEGPTFNNETATAGFSLPVKIIAAKLSDLTITNQLGTSNPLPYAGQSVSVTVPVRNTGKEQTRRSASGSATGFRIAVYINNSGTSLTGATRIGTYTVSGSLASNASQLVTVSATIPSSWQAGKAWLHAVVDDQNVVGNDQNRNNNNSVQTNTALGINVTAANQTKRADVAFAALLWSSSANPYPGQSLSIQVQPKNIGNDTTRKTVGGTSTTFGISLYLSKNANNITGATRIGLATTSTSIGAGGTLLVSINATVPATTTPGSYYLHAVLDSNRDIGNESITSNNASWSSNHSIRINVVKDSKRADLTFATGDKVAINTPTPYTGQQIVVYSVLENKGQDAPRLTVGGTQTGVEYSVYLGKNENNLTGAVRIGGGALRGLSAGAKSSLSIPATIPSSFATGSAWIHVVVDPTRKVGNEGNFVNNATYNLKTSLKVSISGSNKRSNLRQTTKMSVSGVVYAGAPSTYSFRIENNGNEQTLASIGGGSTGFKVRVYLAPNATSTQGATLWREVSTAALGASSSREIKFTLRTPAATKPGSYWLHVVLDEPGDVGNESNLKDNFNAALSLQISIGAIDDKDKDGVKSDKDCDDNDKHNYPGNKEICDGQDNNCDGKVDDTSNLCASGSKCLSGKCVSDCQPTCGSGFVCRNFQCVPNDCYALGCKTGEICLNNKCVTNPCQGVSCASGEYCRAGKCIKTCTGVSCKAGEMCVDGGCVKDPCYTTTCKSGEVCVKGSCQTDRCVGRVCGAARICDPATGKCIDDPCAAITCPNATDYCKNGVCSNNPCQVTCKQGQRCWNGYCVADTCYNFGCPSGQTCSGGQCVQNPCSGVSCNSGEYCLNGKCRKSCSGVTCSNGEICQYGTCVKDPCAGVTCSSGEVCLAGKCQKDLCASVYCGTGQICDKATGKCTTDPCLPINCPSGQVCRNGSCFESPCKPACQQDQVCVNKQCVKNDCYTRGCPSGQICTKGLCIQDPCDNVSCNSGEYCYKGKCVKTCATVTCNTGERCVLGKCEKDPCTGVSCKTGEVCWRGVCITSKCAGVLCPLGKTCNPATGLCEDSSCAHVTCPSRDQYCQNGTCYAYKCNTTCQSGYICYKGQCREDNCYTYGCKAGEVCRQGSCSSDSCKGKTCGSDEFCRGGHCIKSCAKVTCQSDEKCEDGSCVADPCTKVVCKKGEYCDENGSCQTDRCTKVVCGAGRVCEKSTGKCIDDPCAGVTCPGSGQECRNGQCVQSSCNPSCKAGEVCQGGKCVANDCYVRGCPSGQRCRQGFCEEDPCDNKTCAADEFCRDGKCVASCAGVTCAADEFCRDGKCTADPCAGKSCSSGEVCVNGSCVADKCQSVTCGTGRICDPTNGKCVDNPCNNITCPSGEVCKEGNCFKDPNTGEPNEPTEPSENNGENPDVNDGEVVSDADAGDGGDEPNDGDEPKKEDKTDGENKDDKTQDDVDNKDKNSGGKNDGAGVDVPEVPAEGCQCSAAGAPSASFLFFVLFFLGLGSLRRRRR